MGCCDPDDVGLRVAAPAGALSCAFQLPRLPGLSVVAARCWLGGSAPVAVSRPLLERPGRQWPMTCEREHIVAVGVQHGRRLVGG